MGIPLHGRGFVLTNTDQNGLYCDSQGPIPPANYSQTPGYWSYMEILEMMGSQTFEVVVDSCYRTPYAYDSQSGVRLSN